MPVPQWKNVYGTDQTEIEILFAVFGCGDKNKM